MIILIAYAVCALVAARSVAGHIAYSMAITEGEPDGFEWFVGGLTGIFAGTVWPAVLLATIVGRMHVFAIGAERDAVEEARQLREYQEAEDNKRKLRELEAELDRELSR